MRHQDRRAENVDAAQALIEELLRTGLAFTDLLAALLEDLPEDAFPGEEGGAVLMEMIVGTCLPAVEAAGESDCRTATALIGAVLDRVLDDLRAAVDLSRGGER